MAQILLKNQSSRLRKISIVRKTGSVFEPYIDVVYCVESVGTISFAIHATVKRTISG